MACLSSLELFSDYHNSRENGSVCYSDVRHGSHFLSCLHSPKYHCISMLKGQREIQLYLSFLNRRKIPQKCILITNKVKKVDLLVQSEPPG